MPTPAFGRCTHCGAPIDLEPVNPQTLACGCETEGVVEEHTLGCTGLDDPKEPDGRAKAPDPLDDDRDDQAFEPDNLTMERWAAAYLDTEGASDLDDR